MGTPETSGFAIEYDTFSYGCPYKFPMPALKFKAPLHVIAYARQELG